MAKMVQMLMNLKGDPAEIRARIENSDEIKIAHEHGLKELEVVVNFNDPSRGMILTRWKSPEMAKSFSERAGGAPFAKALASPAKIEIGRGEIFTALPIKGKPKPG